MKTLKKLKEQIRDIINCTRYFMKFAWKEKPSFFLWLVLNILVNSFGPFITIIGTKYLINEIAYESNRNINKIVFWAVFICLGTLIYQASKKITEENQYKINDIYNRTLATNLSMRAIKMKFANTENTEMLDKINKAQQGLQETAGVQGIASGITSIVAGFGVLSGVVYLVFTCSVWLFIPVILSFVVNTVFTMRNTVVREEFFAKNSDFERGIDYFNDELIENRYAKDVRIYEAGEMLLANHRKQGQKMYENTKYYFKKMWNNEKMCSIVGEACNISIYIILGINVLIKKITLGEFSSMVQATLRFTEAMNGIVRGYFGMRYTSSILKYYMEFIQEIDKDEADEIVSAKEIPDKSKEIPTIEFKNVSFKYPNTDTYVLRNVSTVIHTGEHLSIVGKNGAGKTTFIKLLCRLYDVTEGEILLNGVNINEYAFKEYVKLLSVVFQDYRLLAFSIRENIALEEGAISEEKESEDLQRRKDKLDKYLMENSVIWVASVIG